MIPSPYLMLLGAWEGLDNMRLNIVERLQLQKPPQVPDALCGKVFIVTGASAGVGEATVGNLTYSCCVFRVTVPSWSVTRQPTMSFLRERVARSIGFLVRRASFTKNATNTAVLLNHLVSTAEALVARGAHVVMAVRSVDKGKRVAKEVRERLASKKVDPVIDVEELDLGSLDSVKRFAKTFNAKKCPLDVLICNAGIMAPPKRLQTKDGLEEQFQVNYLSHWLLAHELLSEQRRRRGSGQAKRTSDGTRVVLVSSMTHHGAKIDWTDLQSERQYRPFQAYANSKAMNIIAAKDFQRRVERNVRNSGDSEDCAVSVHPGLVDTVLARGFFLNAFPPLKPLLNALFPLILRSTQAAALTVLFASTAPAQKVKGGYIEGKSLHQAAAITQDVTVAHKLWDVSCQLTGIETAPELA